MTNEPEQVGELEPRDYVDGDSNAIPTIAIDDHTEVLSITQRPSEAVNILLMDESNPWDAAAPRTPSSDDSISFRGSWSLDSPQGSQGSQNSIENRLNHRNYLAPLRAKRHDGIRSSLLSPAALSTPMSSHRLQSRSSSMASMLSISNLTDDHSLPKARENIRWSKLQKLNDRIYSESGQKVFGVPTCISVSGLLAIGTAMGYVLIFDYKQTCKYVMGSGTLAMESGAVTSLAFSADHTFLAAGHADGSIFTWELRNPKHPTRSIPALEPAVGVSGHFRGSRINHIDFVAARHSAIVSSDVTGLCFLHLPSRRIISASIESIRLLGRHPAQPGQPALKPSSVFACTTLPLGTIPHFTDELGLLCCLTPYRIVIVSTLPIPRTHYKVARPSGILANATLMAGSAAWFPSIEKSGHSLAPILAYSWCRTVWICTIDGSKDNLTVSSRANHTLEFTIDALQWFDRNTLCVLSGLKLITFDAQDLSRIAQCDLLAKMPVSFNLYEQHLSSYFLQREAEYVNQAFALSYDQTFRVFKERFFLLGTYDIYLGIILSWNDRIAALLHNSQHIEAVEALTMYFEGEGELRALGLPTDTAARKAKIRPRLREVVIAAIKYSLNSEILSLRSEAHQTRLVATCSQACLVLEDFDLYFEDIFELYAQTERLEILYIQFGRDILDGHIRSIPTAISKSMTMHYIEQGLFLRIEDIICKLQPECLDTHELIRLCETHDLYNASGYIWTQALHDYVAPMVEFLKVIKRVLGLDMRNGDVDKLGLNTVNAVKVFSYLSLTFSSCVFPTGEDDQSERNVAGKLSLYNFLFSGCSLAWPSNSNNFILSGLSQPEPTFPYLRLMLDFDCPTFLACMDEAFEDSVFNEQQDLITSDDQHISRQFIIVVLLEVMEKSYEAQDLLFLYMFIAQNAPKYPQYILLSGSVFKRVLKGLCASEDAEYRDDCESAIERLLTIYKADSLEELIEDLRVAGYTSVLKQVFRNNSKWNELLGLCLSDDNAPNELFPIMEEIMQLSASSTSHSLKHVVEAFIVKHIEQIANLDGQRIATFVTDFFPELHAELFSRLNRVTNSSYLYLKTILDSSDGFPDWLDVRSLQRYIELLSLYDKNKIMHLLRRIRLSQLDIDAMLTTLSQLGLVEALVFVLTSIGRIEDALAEICNRIDDLSRTVGACDAMETDFEADLAELIVLLNLGASTCSGEVTLLQTQTQSRSIIVTIWSDLLIRTLQSYSTFSSLKLIKTLKVKLKRAVQAVISLLLQSSIGYKNLIVDILQATFNHIETTNDLTTLRPILTDILNDHKYQYQLLMIADTILRQDLAQHISNRTIQRQRGWLTYPQLCAVCGEPIAETNSLHQLARETQAQSQLKIAAQDLTRRQEIERLHGLRSNAGKSKATVERTTLPSETITSFACGHIIHSRCGTTCPCS